MDEDLRRRLFAATAGIQEGVRDLQAAYAQEVLELAELKERYQQAVRDMIRLRADNVRLREENRQLQDALAVATAAITAAADKKNE